MSHFFFAYKTAISAAYVGFHVRNLCLLDITFSLFKLRADNDAPPHPQSLQMKKK